MSEGAVRFWFACVAPVATGFVLLALGAVYWRLREGYRETMARAGEERAQQIEACQTPVWDVDDLKRRVEAGEKQEFCAICQRWKWADRQCEYFQEWKR